MRAYNLTHLSDSVLLRGLHTLVARERETTVAILAHIAEVDERRLYVPAGYSSMHAYCVEELRFSENAAFRRIRAARAARQFPEIFEALAVGSVHLTGVLMLAPHLTTANASELLAAAAQMRKHELESLLAQWFGRPVLPAATFTQLAPARVELLEAGTLAQVVPAAIVPGPEVDGSVRPVPPESDQLAPARVEFPAMVPRVLLQLTIDEDVQMKLRYAQALLSHVVPSGDIAKVFDRALDALIAQTEKRKFGATTNPRPRDSAAPARTRHIPAQVRRAVWERDGGQCTFLGENGHRCGARRFLEFDHVDPVARGGRATESGIRLRCRAHNQFEAERIFGRTFMSAKRRASRRRAARAVTTPTEPHAVHDSTPDLPPVRNHHGTDVVAALRRLGFRADEARRAAAHAMTVSGATLEESLRVGLRFLGTGRRRARARP
jgi:hypothetical protein